MQKAYIVFFDSYFKFYLSLIMSNKILKNLVIQDKHIIDKATFKKIIKNI